MSRSRRFRAITVALVLGWAASAQVRAQETPAAPAQPAPAQPQDPAAAPRTDDPLSRLLDALRELASDNSAHRSAAVHALLGGGSVKPEEALKERIAAIRPQAVSEIDTALRSKRSVVRAQVARIAGELGLTEVAPRLREIVKSDPDAEPRAQAALALGKLKVKEAIPELVGLLKTDATAAAEALELLGEDRVLPDLLNALRRARSRGERVALARALASFGNPAGGHVLIENLATNDGPGLSALGSFLRLTGRNPGFLFTVEGRDNTALTRETAEFWSLHWDETKIGRGSEAVSPELVALVHGLVEELKTAGDDRRAEIRTILSDLHGTAIPPLLRVLQDGAPDQLREEIRDVLFKMGRTAIRPLVQAAATDGPLPYRKFALEMLSDLTVRSWERYEGPILERLKSGVPEVEKLLQGGPAELKPLACRFLGEVGSQTSAAALGEAARAGDPELRLAAVEALDLAGGDAAKEPLKTLLTSDEKGPLADRLRARAAFALARAGDRPAVERLLELLASEDATVRADAIGNLRRLTGGVWFGYRPEADAAGREAAVKRWKDLWAKVGATFVPDVAGIDRGLKIERGNRATRAMIEMDLARLKTEAWQDRADQSDRILAIRGDKVLPSLHAAMKSDDARYRTEVVHLLATVLAPESTPVLVDALKDSEPAVRAAAAEALGFIGNRSPQDGTRDAINEVLEPLLKDGDAQVRTLAAWSMGRCGSAAGVPAMVANLGGDGQVSELAWLALRDTTGEDFGFHCNAGRMAREEATGKAEKWWGEKGKDFKPRNAPRPLIPLPPPNPTPPGSAPTPGDQGK
jgi:HEAT repeat protein